MDTKDTNTTKKPKTAKQMEAFKKANDAKNERLRMWREENLRREARGEEPLVWATKAKARKDALKAKEKEDKLHQLFLKSLEIQKRQLEDDEEKARIEKLKSRSKNTSNSTRKQKAIKPINKVVDDYCYSESDSDSDSEDEFTEPLKTPLRSEPIDTERVEQGLETIEANIDDVRAEFERGEREAQLAKYLLQQQKQLQKQQQPAPAPVQPARPQLPPRPEAVRTEPMDKSEIAKRPQYATRDDFDDLKKEIVNKIQQQQHQQPQIKMNGDSYNLITDTKQKKQQPIEPPKYTTDINYVYNQQTLQKPQEQPLNIVRSSINPEPPAPAPNHNPNLSEERIRSMMGMRQRYEPVQPPKDAIQYTSNSALLNRMFFNNR